MSKFSQLPLSLKVLFIYLFIQIIGGFYYWSITKDEYVFYGLFFAFLATYEAWRLTKSGKYVLSLYIAFVLFLAIFQESPGERLGGVIGGLIMTLLLYKNWNYFKQTQKDEWSNKTITYIVALIIAIIIILLIIGISMF